MRSGSFNVSAWILFCSWLSDVNDIVCEWYAIGLHWSHREEATVFARSSVLLFKRVNRTDEPRLDTATTSVLISKPAEGLCWYIRHERLLEYIKYNSIPTCFYRMQSDKSRPYRDTLIHMCILFAHCLVLRRILLLAKERLRDIVVVCNPISESTWHVKCKHTFWDVNVRRLDYLRKQISGKDWWKNGEIIWMDYDTRCSRKG